MGDLERTDDTGFADAILKRLPTTPVPDGLSARILADFDRVAAGRHHGGLAALLHRMGEFVWPGAPAWQPVSVLALSLVLGLTAGVLVPSPQVASAATDQVFAALDNVVDADMDRETPND
jgi:hypothetical protein